MNVAFYIILYALLCAIVAAMAWLRGVVHGRFVFVLFLVVLLISPLPFLIGLLLIGARPEKKAETPR